MSVKKQTNKNRERKRYKGNIFAREAITKKKKSRLNRKCYCKKAYMKKCIPLLSNVKQIFD